MFCPKCGTKVLDGAEFCQKCGTKIVYEGTASKAQDTHTAEPLPETPAASNTVSDGSDFKAFVDNHVRASTQFQSAEELLNSRVSLQFVWICLGISVLLGIWMPLLLVLTIPFGYLAALFMSFLKKGKYAFKFRGQIDGKVDTDDLIQFLNTHLNYLQPYFHEWGYLERKALSVRGALQNAAMNSAREAIQQINVCSPFGKEQWRLSVLAIYIDQADPSRRDSGGLVYSAEAENKIEGVFFLSHDLGFEKYKCVFKTAPILQAAMEYYLHNYRQN